MSPNLVDLILIVVFVLSVLVGWRRGLIAAGADLAALAGSLVAAFLLYPHVVMLAQRHGADWGVWTAPAAFVIAWMVIRVVLGLVLGRLVTAAPAKVHSHPVNRALGVLPGAANGLINAVIVAMLLLALPLSDGITRAAGESLLADRLAAPAEWLEARLRPVFEPAVQRTLNKLTVQPGSNQSVKLPFTVNDPKPRPDLEAKMLELVNEERREQGLAPLRPDPEATRVARAHSEDMFERGYFSHVTPEGETPFERMREGGLRFRAAGENLAFARTLPMAHQGLMESPGHRANILRPAFGRVGIGILDGGRYGFMVTQKFRN